MTAVGYTLDQHGARLSLGDTSVPMAAGWIFTLPWGGAGFLRADEYDQVHLDDQRLVLRRLADDAEFDWDLTAGVTVAAIVDEDGFWRIDHGGGVTTRLAKDGGR